MQVAAPNLQSDRPASTAQKGKARTKRRSAAERWRRYRSVRLHLDLGREIRTNVYRRSCEVGPSPSTAFRKISRFFFLFVFLPALAAEHNDHQAISCNAQSEDQSIHHRQENLLELSGHHMLYLARLIQVHSEITRTRTGTRTCVI